MVLTEAMPAEMGGVQGFETQTHQCPSCGGNERRFIFVGRNTARTKTAAIECTTHSKKAKISHHVNGADKTLAHPCSSSNAFADQAKENFGSGLERLTAPGSVAVTTLLTSEPPLIEKVAPLNANASGQAWVRAVEKFRRYEADLHQRAEKPKNTNGNIEPRKASDRSTVQPSDETRLVDKLHHGAVGDRLHRQPRRAVPLERGGSDHEALRRFDEFWDLVPRSSTPKPTEPSGAPGRTSVTPLMRPASLVAIEPTPTPGQKMRGKRGFKKMLEKLLQRLEASPFRDR
jgi:hypothetical protein